MRKVMILVKSFVQSTHNHSLKSNKIIIISLLCDAIDAKSTKSFDILRKKC